MSHSGSEESNQGNQGISLRVRVFMRKIHERTLTANAVHKASFPYDVVFFRPKSSFRDNFIQGGSSTLKIRTEVEEG